jgi:RNA polymerase sigma factor (sigma-70 family)
MSELLDATNAEDPLADAPRKRTAGPPIRPTDGERLMRFWRRRDESAFAEVVELHAPMVWGVCSQVLRHRHDVEDAFQATFLILARKAKSIRASESAAGWLYRVAFRTALLARNRRQRMNELPLVDIPASDDEQLEAIARHEQCRVLLEELHALPLQYRQPLVLCYLEGRTRSEAADELGVTPQSVKGRLARGTRMLRSRMVSRGAALSTTMAVVTAFMASAQAAAPSALISKTAALATGFALKLAGAGAKASAVKGGAAVLAEKGILAMTIAAAAKPAVAMLGACLVAGMFTVATADSPRGKDVGGTPIVLLADAGADNQSADDLFADVAATETEEAAVAEAPAAGEEPVSVEPPLVDGVTVVPATAAAPPASQPPLAPGPVMAPAIPGAEAVAASAAAPAVPAEPSTPADVLFDWAIGGPPRPVMAPAPPRVPSLNLRLAEATPLLRMATNSFGPPQSGAPSEKSLAMEMEYWQMKADALKMKADAVRAKAKELQDKDSSSQAEMLEANAEIGLISAEMKLCELNALRLHEALEAAAADGSESDPSSGKAVSSNRAEMRKGSPAPVAEKAVKAVIGLPADKPRKPAASIVASTKAAAAAPKKTIRAIYKPAAEAAKYADYQGMMETLKRWREEMESAPSAKNPLARKQADAFAQLSAEVARIEQAVREQVGDASELETAAKYERLLKLQEMKKQRDQLNADIGQIEHALMRERERLEERTSPAELLEPARD